ncbi:MAG TPA: aldehyde dehydrogenase family protein, partial [Planctomycetota bacterium]|nr:aldehyde dehydrogenase family protein [Planctomycetota bacterium]
MRSVNPATGETIAHYARNSSDQVGRSLLRAVGAAARWRSATPADRAALLRAVAATLRARRDPLATLAVLEMG